MFFKRLKVKNFVTIEEIDIELGQESFFITGENRDEPAASSNGAGKSLLCQSIVWALFDDTLRKSMRKDDVVGFHADWCQVILEIDVNGQQIVIDRVRSHPSRGHDVLVSIDGEDVSKHKNNNQHIETILGISKNLIYYCSYSDSSKEPLAGLSPSLLGQAVAEILDIDRFDTYIKEVRASVRTKKQTLDNLQLKFSERQTQLTSCEKDVVFAEEQLADFERVKKANRKAILKERIAAVEELEEYSRLLVGSEDSIARMALLQAEVDEIEKTNALYARATSKVEAATRRVAKLDRDLVTKQAAVDKVCEAIDNLSGVHSGECQYCGNTLTDSEKAQQLLAQYTADRDAHESELIDVRVDHERADLELKEHKETAKALKDTVEESKAKLTEHSKLSRKIGAYEQIEKSIKVCERQIEKIDRRLEASDNSTPDAIESNLTQKVSQVKKLTEELENVLADMKQGEEEVEDLKTLADVLKQIKLDVYNGFLAKLEDGVNANLEEITDKDFHCQVEDGDTSLALLFTNSSKRGQYLSYHCFSTGEKARINKAVATALNDIIGAGFVIDDEGLNGVDPAGVEHVLEFVVRKNRGKSLFFVSHDHSVQEYFAGGKNLHVIKEDGSTRVEIR